MKNPQARITQSSKPMGPMGPAGRTFAAAYGCVMLLLSLGIAGTASAVTVMTSTTGNVSSDGASRGQHDILVASDRIDLEGNATASLIVDDAAIVRLCHGASLGFASDGGEGSGALDLRAGQLSVSSGKRAGDDPLEIQTPAAVATLLGTKAHLEVDLLTGDTVVTSLKNQVRVSGVGEFADQSVVLSAGEKVTIRKGFGPGAVEPADLDSDSSSSACLDDSRYRTAAVTSARGKYGQSSVGPIAIMDIEDSVPTVAAGPPIIPTGTLGPPTASTFRPCLSYQQCVNASSAAPTFDPAPLPDPPPGGPPPGF